MLTRPRVRERRAHREATAGRPTVRVRASQADSAELCRPMSTRGRSSPFPVRSNGLVWITDTGHASHRGSRHAAWCLARHGRGRGAAARGGSLGRHRGPPPVSSPSRVRCCGLWPRERRRWPVTASRLSRASGPAHRHAPPGGIGGAVIQMPTVWGQDERFRPDFCVQAGLRGTPEQGS